MLFVVRDYSHASTHAKGQHNTECAMLPFGYETMWLLHANTQKLPPPKIEIVREVQRSMLAAYAMAIVRISVPPARNIVVARDREIRKYSFFVMYCKENHNFS